MSSKIIVVIGATGGQGGGVVDLFLKEPGWKVRGTTRTTSSAKAQALTKLGVEMVAADLHDETSLERAFDGATAIFAFTDYYDTFFEIGPERSMNFETEQGIRVARVASKVPSLERLVLSSGPHTSLITNGEAVCPHLEGKGRAASHIIQELPELAAKTTFFSPTIFANNPLLYDIFRPVYVPSAKKYIQMHPVPPETPYPSAGHHGTNTAVWVRSFIRNPPPAGSFVRCNVEDLTMDSYLALWGRATGIAPEEGSTAVVQVSPEAYVRLWGEMGEEQLHQWEFFNWLAKTPGYSWPGVTIVEGLPLLSEEEKKLLVNTEDALGRYDWSSFKKEPTANVSTTRFAQ
ncbi:hypothetical protein F5Y18DRAFT_236289 [Xylariaceae sp. FL1019]|nr:hypothetical protein F5Y18DRAFT_236289 [Xylariaceae sp. FL1019]